MKKRLNKKQFSLVALVGLFAIILVGIIVYRCSGQLIYRLVRDNCYWPFTVAKILWYGAMLAWILWSINKLWHMKD